MYRHLLVTTDGSDLSTIATQHAIALAMAVGAKLSALSVRQPFVNLMQSEFLPMSAPEFDAEQAKLAERYVQEVGREGQASGLSVAMHTVESPSIWQAIVDHAGEQGCDLIVMGSHGRSGIGALLLGSQTQKVLTHSRIPVLVVKGPEKPAA